MTHSQTLVVALPLLLAFGMSACDQRGPAAQAGKKIDAVSQDIGQYFGARAEPMEYQMSEQQYQLSVPEYQLSVPEYQMSEQGVIAVQLFVDAEITAEVKAGLLAEPGLSSMQISVDTIDGIVTLSGVVDTKTSSSAAATRAMTVSGVEQVINHLVFSSAY